MEVTSCSLKKKISLNEAERKIQKAKKELSYKKKKKIESILEVGGPKHNMETIDDGIIF